MVAASWEHMWSTVRKCSSGFPFTIHRQQMDSSSVALISTHSSANTEKYGLDFKLSISFLSSQLLMASKSITAEHLYVYWAFFGPSLTCCWRSSSPFAICNWTRGSNVVVRGRRFLARKYIDLKSLSTMFLFFALLSSASLAAAEHCSCRTLCSFPCSAIRAWITASLWLAMFLELFSSVIPILNSPSSPCTPGCRRCIS